MMNITMTIEQYEKIKRLGDIARWYIDEREPSGKQFFLDLEDVCAGESALHQVDQQLQFS
jgi:hypothetical protein